MYPKRKIPWYFYPPVKILELNKEEIDLRKKSDLKEQSAIYVHVPFCSSICTYCRFYRIKSPEKKELVEGYIEALEKEAVMYAKTPYVRSLKFGVVYVGGGTPSILSSNQLERIIGMCRREFNLSADPQITIEGNSSSFDEDKLGKILSAGANRISLGVQTFNDSLAKSLNLPHTRSQVVEIIRRARDVGHKNISIDLMYNLPGETLGMWEDDLKTAVSLGVDHITAFFLWVLSKTTLEEQLKSNVVSIGSLDQETRMFEAAMKTLSSAGYTQEGLTDFVKPGIQGWKYGHLRAAYTDVLGLGAGSVGYLNHYLYRNLGLEDGYVDMVKKTGFPVNFAKNNTTEEEMHGFMAVGMRALRVRKQEFKNRFGLEIQDVFRETLGRLEAKGLIESTDKEVRLSYLGKLWGGNVCREFYSPEVKRLLGGIVPGKMGHSWKSGAGNLIKRILFH